MRVLIAGGGTGGHLYPGIALARELQGRGMGIEILFVGTARGLESRVLPREGFPLRLIQVDGLLGKGLFKGVRVLLTLPVALWQSFCILREVKPVLVIGVGGYASGPLMLAAIFLGIPRLILEQNVIPGLTNRLLAPRMDAVVVAFEASCSYFRGKRIEVLGNPIRRELLEKERVDPRMQGNQTLLVFGGSRGARTINRAMVEALDILKKEKGRLFIIHQTGEGDFPWVKQAYAERSIQAQVEPFLYEIGEAYRQADFVVGRAGATTIAEVTACGLPAILIPYPFAVHGHQRLNAEVMKKARAAVIIEDGDLTGPRLAQEILRLLHDPEDLRRMGEASRSLGRPQAAVAIADLCLSLIGVGS